MIGRCALPLLLCLEFGFVQQVSAQEKNVPTLTEKVKELEGEVQVLQFQVQQLESARPVSISIDPTNPAQYQVLAIDGGALFIAFENTEDYLDGQKVSILVGNPMSCTYNGIALNVEWGKRRPESNVPKVIGEWLLDLKRKKILFTERLEPGSWTRLTLVLAPANREEFGLMSISAETGQVSLDAAPR